MPLVTVECPAGQLSAAQKADLAEELKRVLLEIEGGGDTPFGRGGSLVRFREMPREDWFLGGTNDGTYVSPSGMFLVELNVPEGLLKDPSGQSGPALGLAAHLVRKPALVEQVLRITEAEIAAIRTVFAHDLEQHRPLAVHQGTVDTAPAAGGTLEVCIHVAAQLWQPQAQFGRAIGRRLLGRKLTQPGELLAVDRAPRILVKQRQTEVGTWGIHRPTRPTAASASRKQRRNRFAMAAGSPSASASPCAA